MLGCLLPSPLMVRAPTSSGLWVVPSLQPQSRPPAQAREPKMDWAGPAFLLLKAHQCSADLSWKHF